MSGLQPPVTRFTLIGALRQGLRWEEFVALYGRLILSWGRRDFGLQDSDAENLRQEVLIKVWKNIAGYDPARGRFRNWLYACTRNAVFNLWRGRRDELPLSALPEQPPAREVPGNHLTGDGDLDGALEFWEEDGFTRPGLREAVLHVRARVQPATWKAFLLFEFLEMRAKEVAPLVGMKPAAVNQAVYRVRQLLQQALAAPSPPAAGRR
jgi:RNA polymerase sigma-70 factor (ECF subfamily)